MSFTVVIPTLGRPSLHRLLSALARPAALPGERSRPLRSSQGVGVDGWGERSRPDGAAEHGVVRIGPADAPTAADRGERSRPNGAAEHGVVRIGPADAPTATDRGERSRPLALAQVVVVDDRRERTRPLAVPEWVTVLAGPGRGPAAARNVGWRAAGTEWVAFLDDDVLPEPGWLDRLTEDLASAPAEVGGVQGRVRVPLPADRRPTDWEAVTAGLATGRWITADMAYRRAALVCAGGFDERLPRAFREDAELAFRVRRAGWSLSRGARWVTHPVRPEGPWVSLRTQRGNADDALLRRLYGRQWRVDLEVPPGRRHRHAAIVAAGASALACGWAAIASGRRGWVGAAPGRRGWVGSGSGRRGWAGVSTGRRGWAGVSTGRRGWAGVSTGRRGWVGAAAVAATVWGAGTAEFAAARILPGPRDRREVAVMVATSVAIPPLAVAHWLRGWWRWRNARPIPISEPSQVEPSAPESVGAAR